MKPSLMAVAASILVFAAAMSAHSAPPQQESTEEKLAKLEQKTEQKFDKAFTVYSGLSDLMGKMEKRVVALESENQMLKIDIAKLKEKLASAPIQPVGKDPIKDPTPKDTELAEASLKIDMAISRLKAGGSIEEASKDLVPLARYSTSKMCEALGKNITDLTFTKALETVLAKCPVDELKVPLADAAKDRLRRASVARVIGALGDKALSAILEPYMGDASYVQQVEIGKALLACRNKRGVSPLLKALKAPDSDTRFLAITYLRAAGGDTFGYDYNKSAEENAGSIKSWESWWEKDGQSLFEK